MWLSTESRDVSCSVMVEGKVSVVDMRVQPEASRECRAGKESTLGMATKSSHRTKEREEES